MKKLLCFVFILFAVFLVLDSRYQLTTVSAQTDRAAQDLNLAAKIRQLTNRSTEGLIEKKSANGTVGLDLQERFQNVMLSRVDNNGEPVAACVTGLNEANAFFGRNLETGEPVSSAPYQKNETETIAAKHGMSVDEFNFYKKLIEDAELRRAENPNSATINIVNADGAGEGFNDATPTTPEGNNNGTTLGAQRLNLFNFAAGIWSAYLDTSVAINVSSQFNPLTPCTTSGGVLGSAGTTSIYRDFPNAQYAGTWYPVALANKRQGTDLNTTTAEINARFNSDVDNGCLGAGTRFYYGLDNTTPSGRINLLVVLLHEMGHGLGFQSFVNGTTGAMNGGFPDVFTRQIFDRTTNKNWADMTDAERQVSALNNNNVFWDGSSVRSASGSLTAGRDTLGRVNLYTPSTFASGSSISHFGTIAFPNLLMEPNINNGLPINLDLTRQEMRDIGWYRDTNADLVPDTITGVTPSGNTIVIGTSTTINWANSDGFNRNVTIEISIDGGATYTALATNVANTGSYTFTVPNTATTQGRVRVREYDFVEPVGVSAANFAISTTAPSARTKFDFDGDGKADVSTFRPSTGAWYLLQSANGFTGTTFGTATDKIVPADFDGDGKTDIAVYRAGIWYLQRSQLGFTGIAFGAADDIPVPADFDGDGKAELAVFRPSNGSWYIYNLVTNQTSGAAFGDSADKPVPADYDGDGKADIAVFRPSTGNWYLQRSTLGFTGIAFGDANDKPVAADYDGDGKTDIAVFRPSNGTWYLQRSQLGFTGIAFGANGDSPAPADYDGDGKADLGVFRQGAWYLQRSTQGFTGVNFGAASDQAVENAFVY